MAIPPFHSRYKRIAVILIAAVLLTSGWSLWRSNDAEPAQAASIDPERLAAGFQTWTDPELQLPDIEPYYADVLKGWREQGVAAAGTEIIIDASKPERLSDEKRFRAGAYEGEDGVLIWETTDTSWVEYELDVPADGLYEMQVTYHPLLGKGRTRPIVWDVKVNGERPYRETSSLTLFREWRDKGEVRTNEDGDQIRPTSIDISTWRTKPVFDSGAAYAEPLLWHFKKGTHILRLEGFEPVALKDIRFVPPASPVSYAEAAANYPASSGGADGGVLTLQAEKMTFKNDPSIQMFSDRDPRTVPPAKGRITYNTVGGVRWDWPLQEIAWSFEVKEAGLYKVALRTEQNRFAQKASFRTIMIDGKVPFKEFLAYRFPYDADWTGTVLQNERGEPYLLYLEKGTHTLSMALTHSTVSPIVRGIENLSYLLQGIKRDLLSLTGGQKDMNRTWDIGRDLPDLTERLRIAAANLKVLSEAMEQANGREDSTSEGFLTSAKDIEALLNKADEIPYHLDEIGSIEEKINNFVVNLYKQPLLIDEIYIAPSGAEFPRMTATVGEEVMGMLGDFAYSFDTRDSLSDMDDTELNVWVQRGRDYVTQLQELSDELFTPETGIRVKVNLLPNPQLLVMSNAANLQPDVALGLSQDLPVDYAIRGSVHDLSRFSDFGAIYDRFSPGSWLPVYYDQGYYAVPETQSFQVLYYRKDILRQLGLEIPDTWEDVYEMLPTLQQHDKNFYVNPGEFIPYIYQNGADFFTPDGLRTALDAPEGFKAFKQWTNLFNTYAVEREVPSFYQHFRSGTMPIGISDYNMYVQLAAAAPELNGRWGIAVIPGTRQADGTISRWAGGMQTTGVIFEASNKKDEAWTFLKWWISTEVQERYGADLESINGVSFRWNTANVEAFTRLPWKKEDANVILQQWRWYKDKANPPGGYFMGRELGNAWVRAVVDGMNYRTSLEQAIVDINRELRRKQQEFGFLDENGKPLKSLAYPIIDKPWEGVSGYVK